METKSNDTTNERVKEPYKRGTFRYHRSKPTDSLLDTVVITEFGINLNQIIGAHTEITKALNVTNGEMIK